MSSTIYIKRLPHSEGIPLPKYQTDGSAGIDLPAAIEGSASIYPGARLLIPPGFAFSIPRTYEGQVRPRSGLALKYGVTVLNSPGTIDSDYRGEVSVLLIYQGSEIDGETIGLITYMSTDGTNISNEAVKEFRSFVEGDLGKNYLPDNPNSYKGKKAKNAQEAHEAIRPTDIKKKPDEMKKYLSTDQFKLYD